MNAARQLDLVAQPESAAEQWDADNPAVWIAFERFAIDAVRAGRVRLGAKAVWERLRWWSQLETTGDPFKLNNNYTAYYARKFRAAHPSHAGLFATRGDAA